MTELTTSVTTTESLRAAVQSGADAVILRRGTRSFAHDEFSRYAEYCRVRGVSVYFSLENYVTDGEFDSAVNLAVEYARLGANAVIVSDLGLVRALRRRMPDLPLFGGEALGIINLDGAKVAAAMGLSRVTLARELPREDVAYIAKYAAVETEVNVHGAQCVAYAGQCAFSAVTERRSANKGACAQLCRLPYGGGAKGDDYPLSLKDACLLTHTEELERAGVRSLKIEAASRSPEFAAFTSRLYATALHDHKSPTATELRDLEEMFSSGGLTDGYRTRKLGREMFGVRGAEPDRDSAFMRTVRRDYQSGEVQRVPVRFIAAVKADKPARLVAQDDRKNTAAAAAGTPEQAYYKPLTSVTLSTMLHSTGGTPFFVRGVKCSVDPGLDLDVKHVNEMRRSVLAQLLEKRRAFKPYAEGEFEPGFQYAGREEPPVFTVSVQNANQLSSEILDLRPEIVYIPADELSKTGIIRPYVDAGITVAVTLPRVMYSGDKKRVEAILKAARSAGIRDALCANLGQIPLVRKLGMTARGDFGLNFTNSQSMRAARDVGLTSAAASFELTLAQLRALSKPVDTEIAAYGRLPLMLTENCVVKLITGVCACDGFRGLEDRRGLLHPVVRESGCRNVIFSAQKLFLADRLAELRNLGLWALRLCFTTENANECAAVYRRYAGFGDYAPGGLTRGLYYA